MHGLHMAAVANRAPIDWWCVECTSTYYMMLPGSGDVALQWYAPARGPPYKASAPIRGIGQVKDAALCR